MARLRRAIHNVLDGKVLKIFCPSDRVQVVDLPHNLQGISRKEFNSYQAKKLEDLRETRADSELVGLHAAELVVHCSMSLKEALITPCHQFLPLTV
jgi:hypothetical protein